MSSACHGRTFRDCEWSSSSSLSLLVREFVYMRVFFLGTPVECKRSFGCWFCLRASDQSEREERRPSPSWSLLLKEKEEGGRKETKKKGGLCKEERRGEERGPGGLRTDGVRLSEGDRKPKKGEWEDKSGPSLRGARRRG
mmetsp:Transcript_31190/g.61484  ORF Transcript_31190/g.61484 Transcript_31190/m.61484 type:complete len:140 (+) Transcript_31190:835-1254(+)